MKTLVLAEKPSVGRDIGRVLKCNKKIDGGLEGSSYIVTWALGHLVTLADPERYDKRYKEWQMEDLPIVPKKFSLIVIKQTAKQFNNVKKLMLRNDVKELVIATDAGREGELVARWIIEKAGVKKPLKRLWISSVTDKAISEGFNKIKDAKLYYNLYLSAKIRAEADWLVGINASRALTCKHNAQLNCGRVQTPTLAIIQSREEEIRNFISKPYYGIKLRVRDVWFNWLADGSSTNTFDQNRVDSVIRDIENKPLVVDDINKTNKKTYAPLLYDLTELQRDANKMFGYSPKKTLSITQNLYEQHKVLTYPRTDSRYLTDDILPTIKERLIASKGGYYDQVIERILGLPINKSSRFINNTKVSDHHAIIPTEESVYLATLSDEEKKVYDLVVKRFLAVLMPAYEYEQTTLITKINQESFKVSGKIEKKLGWKEVYKNVKEEDLLDNQILPMFNSKQVLKVDEVCKVDGKTMPPSYFNEATLLSAMENPVKYMQIKHQKYAEALNETGGLGTVATRADIIEKLYSAFLIEKYGNDLKTTSKGRQLLSLVPKDLKTPEMTAKWELNLSNIADGKLDSRKFIKEIEGYTNTIINEIKDSQETFKHDNKTQKKCPDCGKFLLEVTGKKGKMLVCSDRGCHHRENISMVTNRRCPSCHVKMDLVGKEDKQLFVCKRCGYRERLSVFKKNQEVKKKQAAKNDVRDYMKRQKKEQENIVDDSPFAALLKMKDELK